MEKNPNASSVGWTVLILVSLSAFIIALDSTFMNVAISNLVVDLNTTVSVIQIIISAYALTMASLMLLGGKMQDVWGRKKAFLLGAVIYGVGTTVAALSINSVMLLVGWSILEGIGAALMTPATASIITGTYHGKDRALAIGIWTAMAGIAAAIGPLLGGFLTTFYTWRWGFALELVIVIFILALSRKIDYFPPSMKKSEIDKLGVVLSSSGLLLLVLGVLSLNGITNWRVAPFIICAGLLLLVLFYYREKRMINRDEKPLTDIRLFKNRNFTLGNASRLLMQLALAGAIFTIPVFLQQVTGANAFATGLSLLPLTMGLLIFSVASSKISKHLAPHYMISLGFLVALAGSILLRFQFNLNTQLIDLVPGTALLGIGLGLSLPVTGNLILSTASQDKQSDASGVMATGSNLGSSMGTALIGVVLLLGTFSGLSVAVQQNFPGQISQQEIQENMMVWVESMQTVDFHGLKANDTSAAYTVVNSTISNAMKTAFDVVAIIFFLGFVMSLFIRPVKQ